jgi:hypothetical protein
MQWGLAPSLLIWSVHRKAAFDCQKQKGRLDQQPSRTMSAHSPLLNSRCDGMSAARSRPNPGPLAVTAGFWGAPAVPAVGWDGCRLSGEQPVWGPASPVRPEIYALGSGADGHFLLQFNHGTTAITSAEQRGRKGAAACPNSRGGLDCAASASWSGGDHARASHRRWTALTMPRVRSPPAISLPAAAVLVRAVLDAIAIASAVRALQRAAMTPARNLIGSRSPRRASRSTVPGANGILPRRTSGHCGASVVTAGVLTAEVRPPLSRLP